MPALFSFSRLIFGVLLMLAPVLQAGGWTTLQDCELQKTAYGDGDSFHVHSGSREMIIRLYFVDTPETDSRFPARLKEQADYFHLTVPEVLQLGEKAAEFAKKRLSGRFTVMTQYEDARGASNQPRYYGIVLLDEGHTNFAELLVANGLARVFGAPASRPDGPDANKQIAELHRLEAKAKSQKLGGWGGKTAGGNEDFFNKAKVAGTPTPAISKLASIFPVRTPVPSLQTAIPPKPQPTQVNINALDLNSATVEELDNLPGVSKPMAAKMVAKRPYSSVGDLWNVEGMTEKIYEAVSPLLRVK